MVYPLLLLRRSTRVTHPEFISILRLLLSYDADLNIGYNYKNGTHKDSTFNVIVGDLCYNGHRLPRHTIVDILDICIRNGGDITTVTPVRLEDLIDLKIDIVGIQKLFALHTTRSMEERGTVLPIQGHGPIIEHIGQYLLFGESRGMRRKRSRGRMRR